MWKKKRGNNILHVVKHFNFLELHKVVGSIIRTMQKHAEKRIPATTVSFALWNTPSSSSKILQNRRTPDEGKTKESIEKILRILPRPAISMIRIQWNRTTSRPPWDWGKKLRMKCRVNGGAGVLFSSFFSLASIDDAARARVPYFNRICGGYLRSDGWERRKERRRQHRGWKLRRSTVECWKRAGQVEWNEKIKEDGDKRSSSRCNLPRREENKCSAVIEKNSDVRRYGILVRRGATTGEICFIKIRSCQGEADNEFSEIGR